MKKHQRHKIGSKFAQESAAADNPIFRKNEVQANIALSKVGFSLGIFLSIAFCLFVAILYIVQPQNARSYLFMFVTFPSCALAMLSAKFWAKSKAVYKPGFKFFLIYQFIIVVSLLNICFPKYGMVLWPACIVLSAHYYSPKTTRATYLITMFSALACVYLALFFGEWDSNLLGSAPTFIINGDTAHPIHIDSVTFAERIQYLKENTDRFGKAFYYYFLFRGAGITVTYLLTRALAGRTFDVLNTEANEAAVKERNEHDLFIASSIQNAVLPSSFPDTPKGEVFALMNPAKGVGGDFYDFFNIDEDHLGLVIADVSGKGVPAALFMMKAESLIKSQSITRGMADPSKIISAANHSLCEGNPTNMFVTCWMGILDLNTGELAFANAGHNPPLLYQNGEFKYLKGVRGLVLGGMNSFQYKTNIVQLNKGDKLFLYTDGVTEAHNQDSELYSETRLLKLANENKNLSPKEFIELVRKDIDTFADGAEQFDDITMLMVEYRFSKNDKTTSKKFDANRDNNDLVVDYIEDTLSGWGVDVKAINTFKICAEEIFVNISSYAYEGQKGEVEIEMINEGNNLYIVFKDEGVEFDPLAKEDPNINATAEERSIGGLGILMVKRMMDRVSYKRVRRTNYLTLKKVIKK